MAYFGRTPKKPGQLGRTGGGRTLGGFGPAEQGPSARTVRLVILRTITQTRPARPGRANRAVRADRSARSGRSAR
jgi:hypothetical protein